MDESLILKLLKIRLGIASNARDEYLLHLVESTVAMLDDEKRINAALTNPAISNFVINYTAWMYESKGEMGGMPRHLQFAMHNLMIHNKKPGDTNV